MDTSKNNFLILIKTPSGDFEPWSDLKKSCIAHGWVYRSLLRKALPIVTKDGYTIHRVAV